MNPLLDTEFGDINIEGGVQYTYNLRLADDRSIALGQVVDEEAEEQMSRLLLREASRVLFTVDMH